MEDYFEDIIEKAVSLEIEAEQKATSEEMLHQISDPDVPNDYQYMLVIGVRIYNKEIPEDNQKIYLNFCRAIKVIVDTLFSKSEHGIYVEKKIRSDYPDNSNDHIIQASPSMFNSEYEPYAFDHIINNSWYSLPSVFYLSYYKFSIPLNMRSKSIMLNLFRLLYSIEAYLTDYIIHSRTTHLRNDAQTFILKNSNNEGWTQPSKFGIVTESIFPLFHNAPLYKKNDEDKVIFYYKDLFEPNATVERVRELTEIFKKIMLERGNIKRRANCKRSNINFSSSDVASF